MYGKPKSENPKHDYYRTEHVGSDDTQLLNTVGEPNPDSVHGEDPEVVKAREKRMSRNIIFRQLRFLAVIMFIDIGLPLAIYYTFKMFTTVLIALICSGVPPLLRVFYIAIRYRKIDFLSVICVFAFVISGVLSVVTGDIRATLLRDSFTTLIISCAFLVTLIPLRTKWLSIYPLTHLIAQQMYAEVPPVTWIDENNIERSLARTDWLWENARFHRVFAYTLTALWGIGLCLDFVAKVIMIYTGVSADQVVLFGSVIMAVIAVSLFSFSTIVVIRLRKRYADQETEWRRTNDYTAKYRPNTIASEETYSVKF